MQITLPISNFTLFIHSLIVGRIVCTTYNLLCAGASLLRTRYKPIRVTASQVLYAYAYAYIIYHSLPYLYFVLFLFLSFSLSHSLSLLFCCTRDKKKIHTQTQNSRTLWVRHGNLLHSRVLPRQLSVLCRTKKIKEMNAPISY